MQKGSDWPEKTSQSDQRLLASKHVVTKWFIPGMTTACDINAWSAPPSWTTFKIICQHPLWLPLRTAARIMIHPLSPSPPPCRSYQHQREEAPTFLMLRKEMLQLRASVITGALEPSAMETRRRAYRSCSLTPAHTHHSRIKLVTALSVKKKNPRIAFQSGLNTGFKISPGNHLTAGLIATSREEL